MTHWQRLFWFNTSVLFYKTKDCFSPINTMFSLLSRNPMATFQVSQVSTYIVHPCNEEYDESIGIIWACAVTMCLAATAGVEMSPLKLDVVWIAEKIKLLCVCWLWRDFSVILRNQHVRKIERYAIQIRYFCFFSKLWYPFKKCMFFIPYTSCSP